VSGTGLTVAFLGNDAWSVPSLLALSESSHRIALVGTFPPRPAGRGSKVRATPVAEAARATGLPLTEVDGVRAGTGRDALEAASPDVLVVVAYGELLTPPVLAAARLGAVNVHFSLLPALRGASPVQHALLRGLSRTGVTTMRVDEGLDTGPILLQVTEDIRPEDDAGSLGERLAAAGARLVVRTLDGLAAGSLEAREQDETAASLAPKLGPDDRTLRWTDGAIAIDRRVRALAPAPAATTSFRGEGLKVYRARVLEPGASAAEDAPPEPMGRAVAPPDITPAPGVVLAAGEFGLDVAAGAGAVRLLDVGPAGRRRMGAGEFVRGRRPRPGERLG
jgi:methionyl-tRNA formyltransferase